MIFQSLEIKMLVLEALVYLINVLTALGNQEFSVENIMLLQDFVLVSPVS